MEVRLATIDDLNKLVELESKHFISPWTKEQYTYELTENEFSKTQVMFDGDRLIGYINYWMLFDRAEINKICVDTDYRRKGLATKLMDIASKDFEDHECFSVSLEVRVSNVSAIKLYEKHGFETVLVREKYYADGEDANYMIKGVY